MTGAGNGISITIGAVDATAAAFRSAASRANTFKANVSGVGGALKAFGLAVAPIAAVAATLRSAVANIREMSKLSDLAADANMATPMIQKLSGALAELGVKGASPEMVAHAMQFMTRATGEVGVEGFAKVLGQASRMGDEAERLDFLVKAFGRNQGAAFAAIVRDGGPALERLLQIAGAYPAISEEAAQAGDRASDALTKASDAIKAGWQSMLGDLIIGFEATFGPLPEVAQTIANGIVATFKFVSDVVKTIVLGVRVILEPIVRTVATLVSAVEFLSRAVTDSSYSFSDAFADITGAASDQFGDMVEGWAESAEGLFDFSNIGAKAETKPLFDKMRDALAQGGVTFRNETAKGIADAGRAISNSFSKGGAFALQGSNEARKIIMGGEAMGAGGNDRRQIARTMPTVVDKLSAIVRNTGDLAANLEGLEAI